MVYVRKVISLNNEWYYKPSFSPEDILCPQEKAQTAFEQVALPHTNRELPYHYFSDQDFRFVSCYKKYLFFSSENRGKLVFLDFEGVMTYAEVYVNGDRKSVV